MENIQELRKEEMQNIYGGESFWFRVGQAAGFIVGKLNPNNWPDRVTPEHGGMATWAEIVEVLCLRMSF